MPNFTGKSGGGPHAMKIYGEGKNPIMMTAKQEANLPPQLKAEIAKKEGNPPTNMNHAMKKYGAHKMSHPMKGKGKVKDMSRKQQKAVFASGYKG